MILLLSFYHRNTSPTSNYVSVNGTALVLRWDTYLSFWRIFGCELALLGESTQQCFHASYENISLRLHLFHHQGRIEEMLSCKFAWFFLMSFSPSFLWFHFISRVHPFIINQSGADWWRYTLKEILGMGLISNDISTIQVYPRNLKAIENSYLNQI